MNRSKHTYHSIRSLSIGQYLTNVKTSVSISNCITGRVIKKQRGLLSKILLLLVLGLFSVNTYAQDPTDSLPDDPGAISVSTIQDMKFGAFYQGNSGGSLILSNTGTRSVTGDVVAMNLAVTYNQAAYEVTAAQGAIISITNGPNATLTGSNGGSMVLQIGASSPGSPFQSFVPPPGKTRIDIGGTLVVGTPAANPPGVYSGTFFITFNNE